jgi:3-methyladenine DNA glycosylase AlkD
MDHDLLKSIRQNLREHITLTESQAQFFFKTGKGEYAENDVFLGVRVPDLRKIAHNFSDLSFPHLQSLLSSPVNEERLLSLIILVNQYKKGDLQNKQEIYEFYLKNIQWVNNWNLVDSSAHLILGAHLWDKDRSLLMDLAGSPNLWERRIGMVATWFFIKKDDLEWTFLIAAKLLHDKEDLIHKACGWMLREAGKRNGKALRDFLDQFKLQMPRTMLRYSLEKFSPEDRKIYL